MTTPATGTIPALTEYQPAALTIASTVQVEITDSANASTAASYRMSQIDFVGKAPSIMVAANPASGDLLAFYDISESLPRVTSIGNLGIPFGNMPTGGAAGTILSKVTLTDFDADWVNISTLVSTAAGLTRTGSTSITLGIQTAGIVSSMIATNAIGSTEFRQSVGLSLIGVVGTATANISDITMTNATQVMRASNATTIGFGALTTSHMPAQFQVGAFTSWGVAVTNATAALTGTNFGTTGMFLMGNGSAAAPSFSLVNLGNSTSVTGTAAIITGGTGTNVLSPFGVVLGGTTVLSVVAATTAGLILQAQGATSAPAWVGSGGVLLRTISPSQIGSAVDTTSFSTRYSRFRITFENVCPVSTATLTTSFNMRVATTGVAWISDGYISNLQTNVGLTAVMSSTTAFIMLTGALATTSVGTSPFYGIFGHLEIPNPSSGASGPAYRKMMNGHLTYLTAGAQSTLTNAQAFPIGFFDSTTSPIVGFALSFQTGNISTGTIRIYGIS